MKMTSPLRDLKHSVAFLMLGLTLALPLHAAITDDDLAKVTQLIQEGKATRAKAEITILLDDNPNDPNAPKLRKILDSLGNSSSTTGSQSPSSGPSEAETLQWIQSHMAQLSYTEYCSSVGYNARSVCSIASVEVKNNQLVFVKTFHCDDTGSSLSHSIYEASKYEVTAINLTGGAKIVTRDTSAQGFTISPTSKTEIQFTSKPDKVVVFESRYTSSDNSANLDGAKHVIADEPFELVKSCVMNGQGRKSTASQFSIPVDPDQAERFKKAFDRLIQLNGGGKAEAF